MRNINIEVFPIAKTTVDRLAVQKWLDYLKASNYDVPDDEAVTDPALLIALAAKRCYMSFEVGLNPNVTRVRKDMAEYLDNVLKSGHGSVLEHSTWTFAIEGVSRVFTGELNRHRAGVAISEGSMRYIRFNDIPYWVPTSIQLTPEEDSSVDAFNGPTFIDIALNDGLAVSEFGEIVPESTKAVLRLAQKKLKTQAVFRKHFTQTEENYAELQDIWKDELTPDSKFHGKKQVTSMMRRIVPMGVATGGVWTFNIRAMRHVLALRASPAAEEEIALVFSKVGKIMAEMEPMLFADFTESHEGYFVPKYPKV